VKLPKAVYAGIHLQKSGFYIACLVNRKRFDVAEHVPIGTDIVASVMSWLRDYERTRDANFIGAGISGHGSKAKLRSKLWLDMDIVPIFTRPIGIPPLEMAKKSALTVSGMFDRYNALPAKTLKSNGVRVFPLSRLENFEAITPPAEFRKLLELAEDFEGKRLMFVSATPQGGGVALMRHALMRLFKLVKVNAHWHVMQDDPEIFKITKTKFHNILQNVNSDKGITLEEADRKKFLDWSRKNALRLKPHIKRSDVIVIDDPQPSGLTGYIKEYNPNAKIIYRSHIQLIASLADAPDTPQHISWQFIKENIRGHDVFVAHPIPEFVPLDVEHKKLVYMGATTDPLDGLNKDLPHDQIDYYTRMVNKILADSGQTPLDHARPYIIQIARFDPSKGIPDVIDAYHRLRIKLRKRNLAPPQLVIAGNGSVDDPDGVPIFDLIMELLSSPKYKSLKKDTKVIRLPHYDQLLNTLLRKSTVCLQLSHKEGFEIKISEALMKGIPTIVYNAGGMPLQVKDGEGGYVVNTGDTRAVAKHIYNLLTKKSLYLKMSHDARKNVSRDVLTVKNAIAWLWLARELVKKGKVEANGKYAHQLT